MEGSQRNELLSAFRKFLDKFCSEIDTSTTDDDELPFKPIWDYVLSSEIEGECLYWVLQYLSMFECPPLLGSHIARATFVRISKLDMQQFYMDDDDDDDDDDTDDVDDNEDTAASEQDNGMSQNSQPVDPCIDSRRLLKEVIAVADDVCKQWQHSLPALLLPQRSLQVCSYAIKNTRRRMEDKHVILPDLNSLFNLKDCPSQSYYAVFDGHGGTEAATYAAAHLHTNFLRDSKFITDVPDAIRNSYTQTDDLFLERARKYKLRSGTTCVTLLIQESRLHVSWLGDSQAVLVRNGAAVSIMNPHKPERPDEKERIENLGGCVLHYGTWRVNGNIAVSRAIGDVGQKPFLCSDAEVFSFDLDGTEDYIVLACDGAWDVITFDDLPEIVYEHVEKNGGDKQLVAQQIVNYARDNGSNDNISVIVIFLRDQITAPHKKNSGTDPVQENGAQGDSQDKDGGKKHNSGKERPKSSTTKHENGKKDSNSKHSNKQSSENGCLCSSLGQKLNFENRYSGSKRTNSLSSHIMNSINALLTLKDVSNQICSSHSQDESHPRHKCDKAASVTV